MLDSTEIPDGEVTVSCTKSFENTEHPEKKCQHSTEIPEGEAFSNTICPEGKNPTLF